MAKVTIYTADGGEVEVQDMPDGDAIALLEAWSEGESPLTVTLDDTGASHIAGPHIVRIDVDQED